MEAIISAVRNTRAARSCDERTADRLMFGYRRGRLAWAALTWSSAYCAPKEAYDLVMARKVARERTVTGSMPGGCRRRTHQTPRECICGQNLLRLTNDHSIRLVHCLSPSWQTPSENQASNQTIFPSLPTGLGHLQNRRCLRMRLSAHLLLHGAMTTSASGPALEKCLNNLDLIWCDQ